MGHQLKSSLGLVATVVLGAYFTSIQGLEYGLSQFGFWDSALGSAFYLATGVHGCHVLVGSLFIIVVGLRVHFGTFSLSHHFGFEASAWYWHFVDVVWLLLFVVMYWWGGG